MVRIIRIGEAGYEARRASAMSNARLPERRPAMIFAPGSRQELAEVIRIAASEGHKLAMKSGGHGWNGPSLRDGGALVDLSALSSISVDADRRLALVETGATQKDLAEQIVRHGLAFPIGHSPGVGVGGYLLAGGFGWNPRTWGAACWNVQAIEVTTADGQNLLIDQDHHPDLFWAARGAGPGFPGIATRFHLRLWKLPKILSLHARYRLSALPKLAQWIADAMPKLGPGIEIALISRCLPGDDEPRVTLAGTAFAETIKQAAGLLDVLDDAPCADLVIDGPHREEVQMNTLEGDAAWSDGLRYAVGGCQYKFSSVGEIATRIEQDVRTAPSRLSCIIMALTSYPADAPDVALTRFGDAHISSYAAWERPQDDERNLVWLENHIAGLRPWTLGFYAGECDMVAEPNRAQRCFTPANWARLRTVKAKYDPEGRFFDYPGLSL